MSKRARSRSPIVQTAKTAKTGRPTARAVAAPPLHHLGVRLFSLFALAMILAFWPSYYSRLADQPTSHIHAHGLAMTAWLALLVAQAVLVRSGRRDVHRKLGLVSYALVPAIVIATVRFVHYTLQPVPIQSPNALFFLALVLNTLVAFVLLFALAMVYRKQPALHARWMIATLFPIFTPVTDRLFARFFPVILTWVPRINGSPVMQVSGFLLADVILASIAVWDWTANSRRVFAAALAIVVVYQACVLTFHNFALWAAFGSWFMGLPLS
jgi:uncharacterized membrane protein YozB (DUF420 family)